MADSPSGLEQKSKDAPAPGAAGMLKVFGIAIRPHFMFVIPIVFPISIRIGGHGRIFRSHFGAVQVAAKPPAWLPTLDNFGHGYRLVRIERRWPP